MVRSPREGTHGFPGIVDEHVYLLLTYRGKTCDFDHSPFRWGENLALGGSHRPAHMSKLWYANEVRGTVGIYSFLQTALPLFLLTGL